jgi:peptidoglycan hydrolase-like protein with peptidoglycan-binding domain
MLAKSVGAGGANQQKDVRLVQLLLNDWLGRRQQTLLKVDGIVGPLTTGAIRTFQKSNGSIVDGRVDPDGPTIKALASLHLAALQQGLLESEFVRQASMYRSSGPAPGAGEEVRRRAPQEAIEVYFRMLRDSL